MPFKSQAQRRKFYAMADRGEISKSTVEHWEAATPKGKKLPEKVKKAFTVPLPLKTTLLGAGLGGATGGAIGAAMPDTYEGTKQIDPTWKHRLRSGLTGAGIGAAFGGLAGLIGGVKLKSLKDAVQGESYRFHEPQFDFSGQSQKRWNDFKSDFDARWNKTWGEYQQAQKEYEQAHKEWEQARREWGHWGRSSRSAGRSAQNAPPAWLINAKTKAEAKNAFRQEAMKHHPDVGGDVEKMKQVNMEWESFKNSPAFDKLSYVSFFDELTKIADLAGLVASQLARREVTPPVTQAVSNLEEDIAERWRRFSTPSLDVL